MKVLKSMLLLLIALALVTTFIACDSASGSAGDGGGAVKPPVVIPEGSTVQFVVVEGEFAEMLDLDAVKEMLEEYDWIPYADINNATYDTNSNTLTFVTEIAITQANFDELPFDASYNAETKTLTLDVGGMVPVAHVVFSIEGSDPVPADQAAAEVALDDIGLFTNTAGSYVPSTGTYSFTNPNQFPFLYIQMYPSGMIKYDEDTDTLTLSF